jgi:hypothetical protein
MTSVIFHFARWLAWQLSDHDPAATHRPASITVITSQARD